MDKVMRVYKFYSLALGCSLGLWLVMGKRFGIGLG